MKNKKSTKPKFKPKTIADLKINLVFERQFLNYERFITNFIFNNFNLKNYEIKPNNYIFEILINEKLSSFRIFVLEIDNRLNYLMFELYTQITTYLFENNIYDVIDLVKFETKDSKTFTIKYEVIPF